MPRCNNTEIKRKCQQMKYPKNCHLDIQKVFVEAKSENTFKSMKVLEI